MVTAPRLARLTMIAALLASHGAVAAGTERALNIANAKPDEVVAGAKSQPPVGKDKPPRPTGLPTVLSRAQILEADSARLERIGRHLIIGYHLLSDVKALVAKRAIAGVFITDHNVKGRTASAMKADIDALQAMRREQGLPPLIIAADQEGGSVSRLSPPLKRQPSLGSILAKLTDDAERQKAVEAFAETQAQELKRIGVTMNFGPVVDLNLNPKNRGDGETRLRLRAISADPYTVAKVAGWYCDTLARHDILCTIKHFPGLGRVTRDTHRMMAEISASEGTLELNDWVPFRRLMNRPHVVTMLGHVRVGVLDKTAPASYSQTIIDTLLRQTWGYQGLLITDDFSMGAITRGKPGLGAAAVRSLNAGADYLLVSYSEKHLNALMTALLSADEAGEINLDVRERSRTRIEKVASQPASAQATP